MLDGIGQRVENDLHLTADQVSKCLRTASIRHVQEVHAGHHLEQLAVDVLHAADTCRCHRDFSRVGLCVGDQLGNCLDRKVRINDDDGRTATEDACHWRDVRGKVEVELLVERRVCCVCQCQLKQCVAIGCGLCNGLRRQIASSSSSILDNDLLSEPLREPLANEPRKHINDAASGEADG